jgi:hypothetical protein
MAAMTGDPRATAREPARLLVCTDHAVGAAAFDRWFPVLLIGGMSVFLVTMPLFVTTRGGALSYGLPVGMGAIGVVATFLMARHIRAGKNRRIEVDFDARTVSFFNFRIGRALSLGLRRSPLTTVGFDEVLGVEMLRGSHAAPNRLYIITTEGRAILPETAAGFEELRAVLEEISRATPDPPFIYTVKFIWLTTVVACILALIGVYIGARLLGWWP